MEKVELSDSVTIYHADCLGVLPTLSGVDAVVTDPPYGIGWKPRVNHQDQPWHDDTAFDPRPFLGAGSRHLFWGAQYFADSLPIAEGWAAWLKRPITFDFSKDPRTYATIELAWSDWGKARFICHVWDGGKRAGDRDNRSFCHPAQKPIEVMAWCLDGAGQTILDPYMGSGTTGVACIRTGRKFIGIEIDKTYFAIARKRLENELAQGRLF
ncbi:MAG: hypothetical protein MUP73_04505 [Dehalococcoidia bacterium]|nr:hypothetical protein [Dehalococcoidia bacterium]